MILTTACPWRFPYLNDLDHDFSDMFLVFQVLQALFYFIERKNSLVKNWLDSIGFYSFHHLLHLLSGAYVHATDRAYLEQQLSYTGWEVNTAPEANKCDNAHEFDRTQAVRDCLSSIDFKDMVKPFSVRSELSSS
jgi:hypothetical protein